MAIRLDIDAYKRLLVSARGPRSAPRSPPLREVHHLLAWIERSFTHVTRDSPQNRGLYEASVAVMCDHLAGLSPAEALQAVVWIEFHQHARCVDKQQVVRCKSTVCLRLLSPAELQRGRPTP